MRCKGKLTSWDDAKGFGFITPQGDEKRIFVHIKSFTNRSRRLKSISCSVIQYHRISKGVLVQFKSLHPMRNVS